jgi:plastocyanin
VGTSCRAAPEPDPATLPDSLLRAELGLTDEDVVHRIVLRGGDREVFSPDELAIAEGAWVEFVSDDWRVHEIRFELDSLPAAARAFLEESDQVASPPLVNQGARFLVSFSGAPDGRYPFVAEGNRAPGRGVVVVGPTG